VFIAFKVVTLLAEAFLNRQELFLINRVVDFGALKLASVKRNRI